MVLEIIFTYRLYVEFTKNSFPSISLTHPSNYVKESDKNRKEEGRTYFKSINVWIL